jgi:hypothetical protein
MRKVDSRQKLPAIAKAVNKNQQLPVDFHMHQVASETNERLGRDNYKRSTNSNFHR